MRVLCLIDSLGAGGAERSLAELLPLLQSQGIELVVAIFHERSDGVQSEVEASGVPVIRLPRGRLARFFGVRRVLLDERPDLLYTTLFVSDVVGRIGSIGTGVPVVSSIVNESYSDVRVLDPRVRPWKLWLARLLDSVTARVIGRGFHAITESVAKHAVANLSIDPADVTVIPRGRSRDRLGVASEKRRLAAREQLGIPESEFLVLSVGRQEFQKGQTTLVRAVAALRASGVQTQLVVAGRPGRESANLRELIGSEGIGSYVRLLGHRVDVPDLMVAADALAFPSRFEGLGGTLIEALALGTPIVASDIPVLREVLRGGELGLLVPVDDHRSLAEALETIRHDRPSALERAAKGLEEFESRYRLEAVAAQMASWLKGVH